MKMSPFTQSNNPLCHLSVAIGSALLLCCLPTICTAETVPNSTKVQTATDNSNIERIGIVSKRMPFRGDVPLSALPQSVAVISADTLNEQGITDFQNTIDLASGISRQNTLGGYGIVLPYAVLLGVKTCREDI